MSASTPPATPRAPLLKEAKFLEYADEIRNDLLQFAARKVGWQNAEDAVQECILRAWKAHSRFEDRFGKKGVCGWMYRILRQVIWEMQEKARRQADMDTELTVLCAQSQSVESEAIASLEPEEGLELSEIWRARFYHRIAKTPLTPMQYECLMARCNQEPTRETAERLNLSPSRVRALLSEAVFKIRATSPD